MEKIVEENGKKFWVIGIDYEETFNRVSLDSNYREHARQLGDRFVLLEDDKALFEKILKEASGNVYLKLARMSKGVADGIKYSDTFILMKLRVTPNHEDNILFVLGTSIGSYLDCYVLAQWYMRNNLPEEATRCNEEAGKALDNIVTVVHYRKNAVKRPVNPIL